MTADIFIEFGPRSILSLVGIITLISGVWYVDRTGKKKVPPPINVPKQQLTIAIMSKYRQKI